MSEKAKLRQAHNMNQEEMEALRLEQMAGSVKQVKSSNSDYKIDEHEKHLVHVELEVKSFNPITGAKESEPFVQKFTPQEFKTADQAGHFRGYSTNILHDPSGEAEVTNNADIALEAQKAAEMKAEGGVVDGKPTAKVAVSEVPNVDLTKEILMKGTKLDLQDKYLELYQTKADEAMSKEKLSEAILDRIDFLSGKKVGDHEEE